MKISTREECHRFLKSAAFVHYYEISSDSVHYVDTYSTKGLSWGVVFEVLCPSTPDVSFNICEDTKTLQILRKGEIIGQFRLGRGEEND